MQQKLPSSLSHQDNFYCTSFPGFEIFRSEIFMQTIHTIAGEKEIRTLTMPLLNKHANAEWNAFIFFQKEIHDHHVKAKFNQFCQFIDDSAT